MKKQSHPVTITFTPAALRGFGENLLIALDTPKAHARIVVNSLVAANMRGVDSHGIQMLITYMMQIRAGGMDVSASGKVLEKRGSCLHYDGKNGLGQVIADRCTDHAIRLAKKSGLGLVIAQNANHFGTGAYWGQKLNRAGFIGMVLCNGCPAVAPWQGREARLGTNPFSVAVPGTGGNDWLLDMATTTVALGKLHHAGYLEQPKIPLEWGFLDSSGKPTRDTVAAHPGTPTPFGTYKGSGMAMMVELLSAGLSGGAMATDLPVFRTGGDPLGISHFFLAIDPACFLPLPALKSRVARLSRMVKSSAPADGFDEVLTAGEPERRREKQRNLTGIPVPSKLWSRFLTIAEELGVKAPKPAVRTRRKTKTSI